MSNEKEMKTCFVITPIGENGSITRRKIDGLIDEVIRPVLEKLNYTVIVSHRINDSGTMTSTIIEKAYNSDLVIANLTGNNPNVMYEVAIRHASAKPIIHITENISELPFDINDQRTIEYTDDMSGALELKERLKVMVESINYKECVSNPVTEALSKRDLVNIPEKGDVKLNDVLADIQKDIRNIQREIKRTQQYEKLVNINTHTIEPSEKKIGELVGKNVYLGEARAGRFERDSMGRLMYIKADEE